MSQSPEAAMAAVAAYAQTNGHLPFPAGQWSAPISISAPTMMEAGNWGTVETSPYREQEQTTP